MNKETIKIILWTGFFAIAMGYLESAVVVYLRNIYYPSGFEFPLQPLDANIGITEIFREVATIIMLAGIGILAGKTRVQRFAYFIYAFAIWDIFYYVFLKALLGWPESLMSWDILFLLPVTWVGPVIAPVICSLIMIAFAMLMVNYDLKTGKARIKGMEWVILIIGCIVVIISFTMDYMQFALQHFSFFELFSYTRLDEIMKMPDEYIPQNFPWSVFLLGIFIILFAIGRYTYRMVKIDKQQRLGVIEDEEEAKTEVEAEDVV